MRHLFHCGSSSRSESNVYCTACFWVLDMNAFMVEDLETHTYCFRKEDRRTLRTKIDCMTCKQQHCKYSISGRNIRLLFITIIVVNL
jgi:hypothetical protein